MKRLIDLRSDTVTRPSAAMRQAMMSADTGDDVYGEDPTVNELESLVAQMTGKEAALFVSSGTQGNLLALLSHCERGDEYIAGREAHVYRFEAGGGAVLGGIQPQPIPFDDRGELPLTQLEAAIRPDDFHFTRTRLVCLENTFEGRVLDMDYLDEFGAWANARSLRTHLDGARVFNAAVKLEVPVSRITRHFDTVSVCLSKGLGAPVGSVLAGARQTIDKARRWRKMLGGGMRQAGVIAAAGIHALRCHVERLAEDHEQAARIAAALASMRAFRLKSMPETNMVLLDLPDETFASLRQFLDRHGVRTASQRLVVHRDISPDDVDRLIDLCRRFDGQHAP